MLDFARQEGFWDGTKIRKAGGTFFLSMSFSYLTLLLCSNGVKNCSRDLSWLFAKISSSSFS